MRLSARCLGGALLGAALESPAAAQGRPTDQAAVGVTRQAETLRDLPLGDNVYALLETTQPEVIADRFNAAGLNTGEPARVGAFLASWSQTQFRLGEIDITDPISGGTSLLFPETLFLQQVDIATGLMPPAINAPGLAITLKPRQPTTYWTATASAFGSGGGLASPTPAAGPPPIAYLNDWSRGAGLVSGPLIEDRLGLAAGGSWARASKFQRGETVTSDSELASGFVNLAFTPSPAIRSDTIAWIQHVEAPFEYWRAYGQPAAATRNTSAHVQSTWERRHPDARGWRALGGYTQQSRTNDRPPAPSLTIDRLNDGPIPHVIASIADTTGRRWMVGGRMSPLAPQAGARHSAEIGLDVEGTHARMQNQFAGPVGELVNGLPARLWAFTNPGESTRRATTLAAFASDRFKLSRTLTLDAGLRFESVGASADSAAGDVSWLSWLPRASLRWELDSDGHTAIVGGYRRAANRLNLDVLAYGDPSASTASVARWQPASGSVVPVIDPQAPIVARVGPGTGGDPTFSAIDPDLKRPYTDEFVIGIEARPFGALQVGLTGIARRETNLISDANVGVSVADYSTVTFPDKGTDEAGAADEILTVYNRLPSSFGQDRYLLTNSAEDPATLYALVFTAEASTQRLFMFFGATASTANGSAASTGYGPVENDQDLVGELGSNINAATYARGRLFSDRAFTIKWTTAYRFPGDFRVGAIARYQDGQPYSRLVIAPDLNQGPEAVRAFSSGGTRFTFTGSLDLRLQKGFALGAARLDAIFDVYNLLTRSNEVEEYVVTGPGYRTSTALEPLRAIHLGARVTF